MLTYDEFEDLGGEAKFGALGGAVEPGELATRLRGVVEAWRVGRGAPVVWGYDGKPEAVVMSTAQYRDLRGMISRRRGWLMIRLFVRMPVSRCLVVGRWIWMSGRPRWGRRRRRSSRSCAGRIVRVRESGRGVPARGWA